MLFNSFHFIFFFPFVFLLYFSFPQKWRVGMLLAASYYFYMCWNPAYIILILTSTAIAYWSGVKMAATNNRRNHRAYLIVSLVLNLGILGVFKYLNFTLDSLAAVLNIFHMDFQSPTLRLLLPVGISFYTFQTLSYSIDVYRGEKEPERNPLVFATYVAFFPQLVAGPIERSTHLMPQFYEKHVFEYDRVVSGLRQVLWGFFKKVVIADRLAAYVNQVYNSPGQYEGLPVILATYFFAIQIYCDFSGYSDIAIGTSKMLGYNLMENFRCPYFSQSIAEFWKRWHISLSSWFRDYLYIPLGGNRCSKNRWFINILIVFVVSGLWHGAAWTFVVWGGLHGLYLIFSIVSQPIRNQIAEWTGIVRFPRILAVYRIMVTFHLVLFAWVFFRANSFNDALVHMKSAVSGLSLMVGRGNFSVGISRGDLIMMACSIMGLMCLEYKNLIGRLYSHPIAVVRWAVYVVLGYLLITCGFFKPSEFIYFQF